MNSTEPSVSLPSWKPPLETSSGAPRLALFISSMHCGGAERVTVNLLRAAAEAGIPLDLLLGKAEGSLLSDVPREVRIINLNVAKVRNAIPRIALYLRRERPRSVISHMTHANVVFLMARALARTKTPVVVVEHNHFSAVRAAGEVRPGVQTLARWLYPWADHVVGVSQGVSHDVEQCLGLPPRHVRTIYNPVVDAHLLARAEEPCRHPWLTAGDCPVLLIVGRLATTERPRDDVAGFCHRAANPGGAAGDLWRGKRTRDGSNRSAATSAWRPTSTCPASPTIPMPPCVRRLYSSSPADSKDCPRS